MAWPQRRRSRATIGKARPTRRSLRVLVALFSILVLASAVIAVKVAPPQPAQAFPTTTGTFHGANNNEIQRAVNAVKLQAKANWCGVAAIAWIGYYQGNHSITQQAVANYLNSDAAVSPWGTPPKNAYSGGPGFRADISQDSGTDPRSHAAGLSHVTSSTYSTYVGLDGARDATNHLIADIIHSGQPIAVIVDHGLHTMLVSGVYATGDPVANPSSVTALVVWDPGNPASSSNVQPSTEETVSLSTWLTSSIYWGQPYNSNPILGGKIILDPDPYVSPYTYNTSASKNDYIHLWIGHYVYIRPGGADMNWAFEGSGALIKGWHGEEPTGYTGAIKTLANKVSLSDTTINAPALWSRGDDTSGSEPATVLAWAGSDSAHSINVRTSNDGFHYTNQITLAASTLLRPAVAVIQDHGVSVVVLAWIGRDSEHTLHVLYDVYDARGSAPVDISPRKPVAQFGYHASPTSDYSPSLTVFQGHLWLAWVGTDSAHTVNVLELAHAIRTPWGSSAVPGVTSLAAPTLVADPANNQLLLVWQDANTAQVHVASSPDGANWTTQPPLPVTTQFTPALTVIGSPPTGMSPYQWAWVPSSSNRVINLVQGASDTDTSPTLALSETSPFAPAIGYIGEPNNIMLAWAGNDSSHHIYIASVPV